MKFAYLLVSGCGGCDMTFIDLSDRLIDALEKIEIVFWAPTVADIKYKDLKGMKDKSIDFGFVAGAVRNKENEELVRVMREKCKILVAFGACASLGGIPGMANMHTKDEIFENAYIKSPSTENPNKTIPQPLSKEGEFELTLPEFLDYVKPIDAVVDVDYYVGGCPPHHEHVARIVEMVVTGNLPPKGSWITNGKAVCDVCPRNPTTRSYVREIRRMHEGTPDERCLLEQGYLCLGPITQGDCGALCPRVNVRCAGCGGPIPPTWDFGLRVVSALGAILEDEDVVDRLLETYPVITKIIYRYSLPKSMIKKR